MGFDIPDEPIRTVAQITKQANIYKAQLRAGTAVAPTPSRPARTTYQVAGFGGGTSGAVTIGGGEPPVLPSALAGGGIMGTAGAALGAANIARAVIPAVAGATGISAGTLLGVGGLGLLGYGVAQALGLGEGEGLFGINPEDEIPIVYKGQVVKMPVIKTWRANGRNFYLLANGMRATYKDNGMLRVWRPKTPLVLSRDPRVSKVAKAEKAVFGRLKRLAKASGFLKLEKGARLSRA